jgi:hypothetical protein
LHWGIATCLEGEQGKPRSEWGNEFLVYPIPATPGPDSQSEMFVETTLLMIDWQHSGT